MDMAVTPVIPMFSNRYKWPQSDADFLRSVITDTKETKNRINSTASDESLSLSTSNYSCSSSVCSIDGSSTVGGGSSNYQSMIMHRQMYLRSYKFTKQENRVDKAQNWLDSRRKSMRLKLCEKKKKSSSCDRVFYALLKGLVCCMVIKVDDLYGEEPTAVSSTSACRHPR